MSEHEEFLLKLTDSVIQTSLNAYEKRKNLKMRICHGFMVDMRVFLLEFHIKMFHNIVARRGGRGKGFSNVYGLCYFVIYRQFYLSNRKKATIKSLNVHGNPFTLTAGALKMLFHIHNCDCHSSKSVEVADIFC